MQGQHPGGDGSGSEVSLRHLFQYLVIQCQVCGGSLEPAVLCLEQFQPFGLVYAQAAVLIPPPIEGLLGDSDLTADLAHRAACGHRHLGLTQLGDDLLWRVLLPRHFAPFHV